MVHTRPPCNLYLLSFPSWYNHIDHPELLPLAYSWMPSSYRQLQQGIHTPVNLFNQLDASVTAYLPTDRLSLVNQLYLLSYLLSLIFICYPLSLIFPIFLSPHDCLSPNSSYVSYLIDL